MKYTVIIKKEENGYQATVPLLPKCEARGNTREETLENIRAEIRKTLSQINLVSVDVPSSENEHPWKQYAGMWEHDPTFDDFVSEVTAYRNS